MGVVVRTGRVLLRSLENKSFHWSPMVGMSTSCGFRRAKMDLLQADGDLLCRGGVSAVKIGVKWPGQP